VRDKSSLGEAFLEKLQPSKTIIICGAPVNGEKHEGWRKTLGPGLLEEVAHESQALLCRSRLVGNVTGILKFVGGSNSWGAAQEEVCDARGKAQRTV